jgi:hypothetical protein
MQDVIYKITIPWMQSCSPDCLAANKTTYCTLFEVRKIYDKGAQALNLLSSFFTLNDPIWVGVLGIEAKNDCLSLWS